MTSDAFFVFFTFLAGACVGSFVNVIALRSISGQAMIADRSRCPRCQKTLRWYELVPLFSFIFLGGRCYSCRQPISLQYPIVEILTGIVLVALLLSVQPEQFLGQIISFIIFCILLVLLIIDQHTFLLPDFFIVLLAIAVLLWPTLADTVSERSMFFGVIIGAGFLFLLWLITRGRGIGLGDVKLMIPLGLLLGGAGSVVLLFFAFVIGGLYGLYLLLSGKATPKTALPFGPFLIAVAFVLLLWPDITTSFWHLFV